MSDVPPSIADVLEQVRALVHARYEGSQRAMARDLDLSYSTLSRTLNLDSASALQTRRRNLQRILEAIPPPTPEEMKAFQREQRSAQTSPSDVPGAGHWSAAAAERFVAAVDRTDPVYLPRVRPRSAESSSSPDPEEGEGTLQGIPAAIVGSYVLDPQELPTEIEGRFALCIEGDSMAPTFPPDSWVVVDPIPERVPPVDGIYLFRWGGHLQVKRLQRRGPTRIAVISDHEAYPPYTIDVEAPSESASDSDADAAAAPQGPKADEASGRPADDASPREDRNAGDPAAPGDFVVIGRIRGAFRRF